MHLAEHLLHHVLELVRWPQHPLYQPSYVLAVGAKQLAEGQLVTAPAALDEVVPGRGARRLGVIGSGCHEPKSSLKRGPSPNPTPRPRLLDPPRGAAS